jgi:hypothetical protein
MLAEQPYAAKREPQTAPRLRERRTSPSLRQRARAGALTLAGLFCLVVAFALAVALIVEGTRP